MASFNSLHVCPKLYKSIKQKHNKAGPQSKNDQLCIISHSSIHNILFNNLSTETFEMCELTLS
jgi:hypothetical protein